MYVLAWEEVLLIKPRFLKRSHRNCQAPWQNSQTVQELVERQSVPLALECSYSGALPCAPHTQALRPVLLILRRSALCSCARGAGVVAARQSPAALEVAADPGVCSLPAPAS